MIRPGWPALALKGPLVHAEVGGAVALEVDAVGIGIGARVAVRGVHHQEHAIAAAQVLAVQLAPGASDVNDHLGDAYWRVGRKIDARFQWQHALAMNPGDTLKPVIERNPELREARLSLAKTYIQAGQPEQALQVLDPSSADDALALCLSGAAQLQKENLDEAQRQKLLEIANKCPVHRTLHSEVVIPTRLAG